MGIAHFGKLSPVFILYNTGEKKENYSRLREFQGCCSFPGWMVCYIHLLMQSVRQDRSKWGRAQPCSFLKHLVTTQKSTDMGMVCLAGVRRAARAGCLMKVSTAAAVPVELFCCGLKAKAFCGERKKRKQLLDIQIQKLADWNY